MAQYRAEILHPEVAYGDAVEALTNMDDGELVMRLRPDMLAYHATLNHRAWQPEEPEHESLVPYLRHQTRADLLTAYFGEQDYVADAQLAFANTRPYPTLIYLAPSPNEDEEEEDDFASCNPVYRLRCLGICKTPVEDSSFDMTGNVADGYDALPTEVTSTATGWDIHIGSASNFGNVAYMPTTTAASWTTATAPRPAIRRARPRPIPSYVAPETQDTALEWLRAQADIELEPDTDDDMRF